MKKLRGVSLGMVVAGGLIGAIATITTTTSAAAATGQTASPATQQGPVAKDWPHYSFTMTIDPPTHRLTTTTEVTLPARLAGKNVEFLLGENFQITASQPKVSKLKDTGKETGFAGINGTSAELANRRGISRYRVRLPAGTHSFRVEYSGLVDLPPTTSPEEYARSFAETPGIIEPKGLYLAGSTLWYPQLAASELVTFDLTAKIPPGWHIIAPGNGVSTGPDNVAHWTTPSAVDEISVAGGPLTYYHESAGPVEAQVFLREDDAALATKYLDATNRYLRMYNDLIGPYPYTKFALVENFWETGYGMPSYTLLGPQIIRFPFILTSSYPHEILHNWWGNSVYVDYATGNWCEGLTAYLADHLLKEGEGLGAEYRRDVLKKYRDFATTGDDFPLTQFRSRHSAVTEAVGYGKTLMGFHMLRRQVGDDTFRKVLSTFYREDRGTRASFGDIEAVFEKTTGQDFSRFFSDWTTRTGAPELAVKDISVKPNGGKFKITGHLLQQQKGPYDLQVPVVVMTAAGTSTTFVRSQAADTAFSIEADAEPQLVAVDPEFDLFRVLDPRETAPSIGQLFGASAVTAVLPTEPAGAADQWRRMLAAWKSPSQKMTIVTDRELETLPTDQAVWLLGRQNRLAKASFSSQSAQGLTIDESGIRVGDQALPFAGHAHVLTGRHPTDPRLAIGWITADSPAAVENLGRKLPHYGKYSWLVFAGDEATNVAKGEWAATDSPLMVSLKPGAMLSGLPKRTPLAVPPPVFSAERLQDHVNWLAAPAREGRGFGSAGLIAAGDYIRDQFAAAGLKAGGDQGTYFQTFEAVGGLKNEKKPLRNVIAVLPGNDPRFAGQAALLTAHYDHLGMGWPGVRSGDEGKLHPGADDNASGVSVLLEVAKHLAAGPPPARTIVFVAFSGEEAGLLGSRYYAKHPSPVPAKGLVGVVNMDTVGRLGQKPLSVLASDSAREWPFVFGGITAVTGIPTASIPGASQSSDQQSFIDIGVPGVQLFTAATGDYHRPSDTADKIDSAGLARVAEVATEAIGYLASAEKPLTATGKDVGAADNAGPGTGPSRRASLGSVPDFAYQGSGLRIDGVVPDSPAAKAGMQAGDILVSMGGKPVTNLNTFNQVLRDHNPGDRTKIEWTRNGTSMSAEVELGTR
ncbi:MAG: M20/M25/M40 family metallo-hydrolase [Gammaproteobacteria bacterium]